jgi:hypothetical protein
VFSGAGLVAYMLHLAPPKSEVISHEYPVCSALPGGRPAIASSRYSRYLAHFAVAEGLFLSGRMEGLREKMGSWTIRGTQNFFFGHHGGGD